VASREWNVVSTGDDLDCSFHSVHTKYSAQSYVRSFIVSYCFCPSLRPGEALTIRDRLFKALP